MNTCKCCTCLGRYMHSMLECSYHSRTTASDDLVAPALLSSTRLPMLDDQHCAPLNEGCVAVLQHTVSHAPTLQARASRVPITHATVHAADNGHNDSCPLSRSVYLGNLTDRREQSPAEASWKNRKLSSTKPPSCPTRLVKTQNGWTRRLSWRCYMIGILVVW